MAIERTPEDKKRFLEQMARISESLETRKTRRGAKMPHEIEPCIHGDSDCADCRTDGKPTELPWSVRPGRTKINGDSMKAICGADGIVFAFVSDENLIVNPRQGANAELIVRAVNAHDELVEALKDCQNQLDTLRVECGVKHHHWLNERVNLVSAALLAADKAIKKAEGR